jgi:hypothetical protein
LELILVEPAHTPLADSANTANAANTN